MMNFKDGVNLQFKKNRQLSTRSKGITDRIDGLYSKCITYKRLDEIRGTSVGITSGCEQLNERIYNITQTLTDDINIIVLGSISTGKSTILNAILHKKIMSPSAFHTTRCFFRISRGHMHYVEYPNNETMTYTSPSMVERHLTLETNKLRDLGETQDIEIKVFLNIDCRILQKKVYLIDTPGLGRERRITDCVMNKCKGADIAIFVMNHSFSAEIKKIMKELSELISDIPTFVLVNKWDETDDDTDEEDLQNIKANLEISVREGMAGVDLGRRQNCETSDKRIFHVSAEEIMRHEGCTVRNKRCQQRYDEFNLFEDNLLEMVKSQKNHKEMRHERSFRDIQAKYSALSEVGNDNVKELNEVLPGIKSKYSEINDGVSDLLYKADKNKNEIPERVDKLRYELCGKEINSNLLGMDGDVSDSIKAAITLMDKFQSLMPEKKKEINMQRNQLETRVRNLNELKIQREEFYKKAMIFKYAAASTTSATGVGAAALGLSWALLAPVAAAATLGVAAYIYNNWGNEADAKMEIDLDKLRKMLDQFVKDIQEAYEELIERINDSEMQSDCHNSIVLIEQFIQMLNTQYRHM